MDKIYYIFSRYYHKLLKEAITTENTHIVDLMNKKLIHTFRVID